MPLINIARGVMATVRIPKIIFWLAVDVRKDIIIEVHVAELLKPKDPKDLKLEVEFDKGLWVGGNVEKIIKDVIERVKPPVMELMITTVNNKLREAIEEALEKFQRK